jgi:hypothetical protein
MRELAPVVFAIRVLCREILLRYWSLYMLQNTINTENKVV